MKERLPKDEFFEAMAQQHITLTFDDVRLKTGHAKVMPADVFLETKFSRNITLQVPFVSAAMDTVTEYRMAIEMARLGSLGIIHRNLSPEEQAAQVGKVKHCLHGLIPRPITVHEGDTIESILHFREEKGYGFQTFPVLDNDGKFVGILTGNDFDLCDSYSQTAGEVMTKTAVTAPPGISSDKAYAIMQKERKKVLPLLSEDGTLVGMYTWKDLQRMKKENKDYTVDCNGQLRVGAAIGTGEEALLRVEKLLDEQVDVVVIDSAHADSLPVLETITEIKRRYGSLELVAGNISEADSVGRLLDAGVDGIKIGQGGGSICTTRIVAGIGCPQVTAVYQCARVSYVPVCSDGGIRYSGDIPIALGAGADCVMLGKMFAGTDEAPGEVVLWKGRQWKAYRGMGSLGAMEQHAGSRDRYTQSAGSPLVPEGVEGVEPYKGKLQSTILQLLGGLRKGMGYVGAASITELQRKADFRRLTSAGQEESHPHDIEITADAPNYQGRK